ncbi:AbrB family transcriptional regulator [Salinicoccus sp. HZC-1]|uniref:AbrB family transcriptional regulator n=1 Tax=Salinicoccus sp. HZC-1 TaxID=3385497 RepID=UPI00398AC8D9
MKYVRLLFLFIAAFVLSWVLHTAGLILPWLFGSMIATIIFYRLFGSDLGFKKWMGDIGIFIIGIEIGSTFTKETILDMQNDVFNIVLLSLLVIVLSLVLARFFMKMTGCTYETAVLATIPGALSQMIIMAEEEKRADLLLVTLTQMSRIVLVVIFIPFIASLFSNGSAGSKEDAVPDIISMLIPEMFFLLAGAVILMFILKFLKFPVPVMIAPMISVLVWNLLTDHTFSLNVEFMHFAQILFGIRIGLQISSLINRLNGRMVISMLIQNVLLILGTMVIVIIFIFFTEHSFNDLFLSAAPGGIGQIIIVAVEMGANIAMISSYHIFRIFFILLIVAPIINIILSVNRKRRRQNGEET